MFIACNLHYEKFQDGTVKCIDDEIPFDIPEGWEWCRIGSLFNTITGSTPSTKNKEYYGDDYPFYKPTDLDNGYDVYDSSDHVSAAGYEAGRPLPENSVLITCIGATIGKTGLIHNTGICNQQINALLPSSYISSDFAFYSMCSEFEQTQIISNASATTLPILNKSRFDTLLFAVPPFQQQIRISDETKKLLELVSVLEENKDSLHDIISDTKSKILDMAIKGKLAPQNPNDEPASILLKRIQTEKENLIKQGKLKRDKKESIIYKGDDNSYYEKLSDGTINCIDEELPFDIPYSWRWERLRNLFVVNPKNNVDDDVHVSFIPMALLDDGYSGEYTFEERAWKECKKGFTHFADGDVCFAKISPCFENRKSAYFQDLCNGYGAGTTELYVLRRYTDDIMPEYLLSFVKSEYFISRGRNTFSGVVGQQRVDKEVMLDTFIPIPPITEQNRINNTIKIAFSQISNIEDGIT